MPKFPDKKSKAHKELAGTDQISKRKTAKLPASLSEHSGNRAPSFHEPPDYLSPEGKDIYKILVRHLQSVDALWAIDSFIIEKAAHWMAVHNQAVRAISEKEANGENGLIQTFSTGAKQISVELQVLDKAELHVRKYFELLGIGPKSREAIGVFNTTGGSETQDPFTMLRNKMDSEPADVVKSEKPD